MPYIDVALNLPVDKVFCYQVPDDGSIGQRIRRTATPPKKRTASRSAPGETDAPLTGRRVEVRFAGRRLPGFVTAVRDAPPPDLPAGTVVQPILRFIDMAPVCSPKTLELAHWLSGYYFCSLGQALATMIPPGRRGTATADLAAARLPARDSGATETLYPLNAGQTEAVRVISQGIEENAGRRFLLHGVTGSGKTEVYRHLARRAVQSGRQVVILVPEISLTPQTIGRFASIFPGQIAVLHSRLTAAERIGEWRRLASGEAQVAIGARSAVFAPVGEDSLFIIDEEHESSYKADDCPRYHARQVAFRRTARTGCLVLGSATPSIESLWHAHSGAITRVALDERISAHAEHEVIILDMKHQPQGALVAPPLVSAAREAFGRGEQALFFLNRRGYAPWITCDDCSTAASCPHCSISLTLHRERGILLCHHCGYSLPFNGRCPSCGGAKIRTGGAGTERVVEFLEKRMSGLRLGRVDSDTIAGSKDALFEILEDFSHKRLDALVGTQMVAKGLDFPDLTVVGILAADAELALPDFRSFERVHTQLVQVIGRTGRAGKKGRAFIQTSLPDEDPIASIIRRDSAGFILREIERRRECGWPPFSRLVRIVMRSSEPEPALEAITTCASELRGILPAGVSLLGPVSCPVEKRANWWRYHLLLKAASMTTLAGLLRQAGLAEGGRGKVYVEIDVDPQSML